MASKPAIISSSIPSSPSHSTSTPVATAGRERDGKHHHHHHHTAPSSPLAKLMGSATAGILELLLFHPIDTATKRLMTHQQPIFGADKSFSMSFSEAGTVVFKGEQKGILSRYIALLPGLTFAAAYKVSQRVYKFGSQPLVFEYLEKHHSQAFKNKFGTNANTMMSATAGSLIGIGEIVLLPLDVLKIKSQTNIEALQKRNMFTIIKQEGIGSLYKGIPLVAFSQFV